MPSVAGLRPPLGVHPPVPPSGVQVSSRPVSSRPVSGRLAPSSGSGCPAVWCQPVRRPAVWCPSVRPIASISSPSAGGGDGDTSVRPGQPSRLERGEFMWSGPSPAARSTARVGLDAGNPGRPGRGQRCGGRVEASGGASAADLGRVVLGREAAADRPGRPDRRKGRPVAGDCARQGCWLKRDVPAPAAWLPPWLERDYSPWLSWSLTPAWTGSAGPTSLTARMGARPQRGPGVQGVLQARRWQRFDLREWWWARQGLNL